MVAIEVNKNTFYEQIANRRNVSAQQVLAQVLDSGSEYEFEISVESEDVSESEDETAIQQTGEVGLTNERDGENGPAVCHLTSAGKYNRILHFTSNKIVI